MMGTILVLGYAALWVLVFKILRMPVNRWTVTTAAVSGVVVVGGLLLGMDYNHPLATDGRLYFYTTPITPTVQGIVIEVAVRPNVPLNKGDVLFRLDPRPYQAVVDQKKALLAEAEQNVKLLNASYDQALAAAAKARAELELAQQTYDRQLELFEKKVVKPAPEQTRQHLDVHQEVRPARDPSRAIKGDAAARHDHVDMGMVASTPTIP